MTRTLEIVASDSPLAVLPRLRDALSQGGAAILPRGSASLNAASPKTPDSGVPAKVAQNVALVIETSGSSGVPKRVALSTGALLASAAATSSALGGDGQWLLALPVNYIAGSQVLVRSIVGDTTPVVQPPGHFSARVFASLIDELDAPRTFTSLVPAQLARVIDAAEADAGIRDRVRTLDAILVGGQALPPAVYQRAVELGLAVRRTYGSSETAGGCVYDGIPLSQVHARVTSGELELAGPMLAEGYLGDEELTARAFYTGGGRRWYRTADAGEVRDGVVSVSGRVDNVIISGGIKVSLDRIEHIVQSLAGFGGAVVVPQPSEEWGQVSVVVTEGEVDAGSLDRVRAAVIAGSGRAAAPVRIVRVAALPTLATGKPDRLALARTLASESAR